VRSVLAVLLAVGSPLRPAWAERRAQPQAHEWSADLVVTASELSNAAMVAIQYVWTPETLDRFDVVVPALRRFVRHPSSLFARVRHDGNTIDQRSSLEGGGVLQLLGGHLYASGQAGIERDQVRYSFDEDVYWAAPFRLEVGGRPTDLLSVGAFFRGRPIFTATAPDDIAFPAYRSGTESWLGGTVSAATPNDRLLATLRAAWYTANWDFEGFHPGPMDITGVHAELELSLQTSSSSSLILAFKGRREDWDNQRMLEELPQFVGPDVERKLWAFEGDVGYRYWFRGKLGFHATIGGGFETEPPIYYAAEGFDVGTRGFGRLGFGFVTRY
jgi:hypothetical protein